jgi:RNA polymerase sigma-70 factor (ECF subfamily)
MEADSDLVARAAAGDEQAFAALLERYRDRVFRLAVSILGQAFVGEAEEVTQEVFLRVHHALKSFRGESKFGTWLYRVTFNQTINLKSRVRFNAPHVTDDALARQAAADPDALTRLERARRDAVVAECVAELPVAYQSALRLHYWMGESIAEISTLLDVPENTVKSYLFRARQLLQSKLKNRGYDNA